jgi:hypothetical protein
LKRELNDKDLSLSSLSILPNEILSYIFEFLPPLDLGMVLF